MKVPGLKHSLCAGFSSLFTQQWVLESSELGKVKAVRERSGAPPQIVSTLTAISSIAIGYGPTFTQFSMSMVRNAVVINVYDWGTYESK